MDLELNEISGAVVNSAICVHTELGPGLLEETYKQCLTYELQSRGFKVSVEHELRNLPLPGRTIAALPIPTHNILVELGKKQ
jgi:GxxExxY protein